MGTLFATDLPERARVEFDAEGLSRPAVGVIHRRSYPAACGMPLGGIDTGCLDLETSGLFGLYSVLNSHTPRIGALDLPFLGLNIADQSWVLATGQRSAEKGRGPNAFYYENLNLDGVVPPGGHGRTGQPRRCCSLTASRMAARAVNSFRARRRRT